MLAAMRVILFLMALALGCTEPAPPPALDPAPAPSDGALRIAGEPAASPLIRNLARTFSARLPGPAVVVEPPLPADGARRALQSGVLGAAIVMTLRDTPPAPGAVAVARTYPILAAGPGVRLRAMTLRGLIETLQGKRPTWIDGLARQVLLRPGGDPVQAAFTARWPLLRDAFTEATASGRWRVLDSDAALRGTLRQTPGAIAVVDTGNIAMHAAPFWPLRFPKAPPLTIWLVPGPTPSPRMQAFVAFLRSAACRSLVSDLGYERIGGAL